MTGWGHRWPDAGPATAAQRTLMCHVRGGVERGARPSGQTPAAKLRRAPGQGVAACDGTGQRVHTQAAGAQEGAEARGHGPRRRAAEAWARDKSKGLARAATKRKGAAKRKTRGALSRGARRSCGVCRVIVHMLGTALISTCWHFPAGVLYACYWASCCLCGAQRPKNARANTSVFFWKGFKRAQAGKRASPATSARRAARPAAGALHQLPKLLAPSPQLAPSSPPPLSPAAAQPAAAASAAAPPTRITSRR
jgi:hypothetical protein